MDFTLEVDVRPLYVGGCGWIGVDLRELLATKAWLSTSETAGDWLRTKNY